MSRRRNPWAGPDSRTRSAKAQGYPARSVFKLEEIDRRRESPSLDAFIELALARGLRLRFATVSLLGQPELRDRLFYAPDRRGALDHAELGERDPGSWYQLSISGSF